MEEKKLLMIGNSFSWNAYTYLQKIADSGPKKLTVGNLCYGGCSLQMHQDFFENGSGVYGFECTGRNGNGSCDIDTALACDDWTHISLQQVSGLAGDFETYRPYLDYVYNYVRRRVPNAEIIIHQTWAYQHDSTHEHFKDYRNDQNYMFERVKEAYCLAAACMNIKKIVPSGEAFQIARRTPIGDTLCEDGFHANVKGQYLAGGAFYEVVTGGSIFDTAFKPDGITDKEFALLRDSIHLAVDIYSDFD
ncbi:MAG: DUF4886 domain-containing protein [Clostridia bacterium]|nr:DUF4886 domain-containing protein [Clostridia bacterium]